MTQDGPLAKAARRLRDDVELHDVKFMCVDGNVSANKAYLAACSDYFKAMFFSNPMAEAASGVVDLSPAGISKAGNRSSTVRLIFFQSTWKLLNIMYCS